uniref:Sulfhydryl oxidase n=1 Tax=Blastobotrys adeninivorans TaxID=409370 RepID=A0A060TI77_BLAAD
MLRRPSLTLAAIVIAFVLLVVFVLTPPSPSSYAVADVKAEAPVDKTAQVPGLALPDQSVIQGKPIMAKMANETKRAELGNAGWKLLHTVLAQYPENPTEEEKVTLRSFIHLFSRVYPCRECAEHFQQLLREYPPQVSSREAASMWGCDAHNKVNIRLNKPVFDCNEVSNKYSCGCAEDEEEEGEGKGISMILDEIEDTPTMG